MAIGGSDPCDLGHVSVPAKWHLILSSGFSRVYECDRRTDGPHADTSVAVGIITDAMMPTKGKHRCVLCN